MFLEDILGHVQLENEDLECKGRLDRDNTLGWLKTISGFSNAKGGTMFIGVENKEHKLIGFNRHDADVERNYLNNEINEHIVPRPQYDVSFIRYENNNKELFIIRVDIKESEYKPIILKHDGVPSIYMRRQGFTNGATYEEIINMGISSKNIQYDKIKSDMKYDSSNFSRLFSFCENRNDGNNVLTDKALASMGFFTEDGYLTNGAVLFTDGYYGDKTEVQCSVFSGLTRGSERIVSLNKFNGNIVDSIDYMFEYVKQRMNHSVIKQADSRINIDAFPERALFEGIINAVAHRDYYLDGTQVQIEIFKNRLEITSPGGFYQHESIGKSYDLSSIISKRRNEMICDVLVKCNAMEAAGTGFEKIADEYSEADDLHRPYILAESDHFTLVLPDLTYADGLRAEDAPEIDYFPVANNSKHDKKILEYCYKYPRSAKDISEYIGVSNSTYLRHTVINNLVAHGLLTEEKINKTKYYRTNKDAVELR